MTHHPEVIRLIRHELANWKKWSGRALVLAYAALTGLCVVGFTWLTEAALSCFHLLHLWAWWAPLIVTPLSTGLIVWGVRRWVPGSAGSGIAQVIAALDPAVPAAQVPLFVSVRLSFAKVFLTAWGLLAGLSIGREGPTVQIAAGIMLHARQLIPARARISAHSLLIAGGAAGIAAAFNTPLGGVMFAIEELTRHPNQRSNSLILAAIVLSGLVAVSAYGNATYFGVIRIEALSWSLLWPALLLAIACGVSGGVFSRLIVLTTAGTSRDPATRFKQKHPVLFAAGIGAVIAFVGVASAGATFGSGYQHTKQLLAGAAESNSFYFALKFMVTWLSTWSGVPGGIFAPSLAIGGALGYDIASIVHYPSSPTLIALGMAGFLAAATQAPLTSFIIVMEMVDGHALVLSLMTCALFAAGISRLISAPLYISLAKLQLGRLGAGSSNDNYLA